MATQLPPITLVCHVGQCEVDTGRILQISKRLLPACIAECGPHPPRLDRLEEIDISLVDDATIARVHERFMGIAGPTDVITFQHGEIVVSVDTARANADEHGQTLEREILRYIVHGILHLNGHEDSVPGEREAMHAVQEEILKKVFP